MSIEARRAALQEIESVVLPQGWSPMMKHGNWERISFYSPLQISMSAMGTSPGRITVRGNGCEVICSCGDVQRAVDHVLAWAYTCK